MSHIDIKYVTHWHYPNTHKTYIKKYFHHKLSILNTDTFFKQVTIRESRKQKEVLDAAFIEDAEVPDEDNNTEQRPSHSKKHIMTRA